MPRLVQLMDLDLIDVHVLQVGSDREQLDPWKDHERLTDWGDRLPDFAATATVIQQLDLVISVDTAVAHLAGALHRPTWLLLPQNADFRWLRERADSPWYPSMRLFRQPGVKDWSGLVAELNDALDQLVMFDVASLAESVGMNDLKDISAHLSDGRVLDLVRRLELRPQLLRRLLEEQITALVPIDQWIEQENPRFRGAQGRDGVLMGLDVRGSGAASLASRGAAALCGTALRAGSGGCVPEAGQHG